MTTVLLNLVGPGLFIVLRMLTQAGSHDKPSLSAWPSHVVKLGQYVELQCNYHNEPCMFKIYKEIGDPIPQLHNKTSYGRILLGPVTPAYGGIYRCYNYNQYPNRLISHSDPLKIIISGIYRKPFLSILSTPLVNTEEKVTINCHSETMFDTFILTSHKNDIFKESYQLPAESHITGSHTSFSIGPVTPDHAGTYTCYGSYEPISYEWSESSVPIDICITGLYKKPSLSALMGPGENITLSCISDLQFDMFHLSVDGVPQEHGLPGVHSHGGTFQANFLLVLVIQAGNYSCYGSFRNSSHVWSSPSDPLYLPVTAFFFGQTIWAQEEFPIPTISTATSPLVPWNESVRILCRGTPEAFLYQLSLIENSTYTVIEKKLGFQKEAEFTINRMNATMAGCYQCQYRKKSNWSKQSEPLELVVTGLYDKPILSTDHSHVLTPGENISFKCTSAQNLFNRFSLHQEGKASLPWLQHEENQGHFSLGPMNPNFAGNYMCYGWYSSSPYVWSAPSNILEIIVTESMKQEYMVDNSVRMGMAGLVLVVLLVILAEDWNHQRVSHKEDCQEMAAQR